MNYYAGIGSRETPSSIQKQMFKIAIELSRSNFCLRSGGAEGADDAFERGAEYKQIFLPWNGFNGRQEDGASYIVPPFNEHYTLKYHPKPSSLSFTAKKFMSRNAYQVLGPDLNNPVDFILCWTKDGKALGGTGQAIRIANDYQIPVFNLRNEDAYSSLTTYMFFNHTITI